jgi:hypothetical protein
VAREIQAPNGQAEELLSKLLAISLWTAGASQGTIARAVNKSKTWVNEFLKGVPKPR